MIAKRKQLRPRNPRDFSGAENEELAGELAASAAFFSPGTLSNLMSTAAERLRADVFGLPDLPFLSKSVSWQGGKEIHTLRFRAPPKSG